MVHRSSLTYYMDRNGFLLAVGMTSSLEAPGKYFSTTRNHVKSFQLIYPLFGGDYKTKQKGDNKTTVQMR